MKPIFIGIAGGTGSGKTYLSKQLVKELGEKSITRIELDSYYKDNSDLCLLDREKINYDHPESLDQELIVEQMIQLGKWENVNVPKYNFSNHTRFKSINKITPKNIIILDGIFALYFQEVYKLLDVKIFLNTPKDISFIRRLKRDIVYRGRSLDSVIEQYLYSVRPMYEKYIKPTKSLADIIINHNYDLFELKNNLNLLIKENSRDQK